MNNEFYVMPNVPYYIVQQESATIGKPYSKSAWEIKYFKNGNLAIEYALAISKEMDKDNENFNKFGENLLGISVLIVTENTDCLRDWAEVIFHIPYNGGL